VCFAAAERTAAEPMLPTRLLRDRRRIRAMTTYFLVFAWLYPTMFLMTRLLQTVLGYGPLRTGLGFLPAGIGIVVGAGIARKLLVRFEARSMAVVGALLCAASAAVFSPVGVHASYPTVLLPALLLLGFGFGISAVSNTLPAMHDVTPADSGAAAGVFTTAGQVGGALGVALCAAVASSVEASRRAAGVSARDALVAGFHPGFALAAVLAVLAALAAVAVRRPAPTAVDTATAHPSSSKA
jgi:predicted MFS family arabinose efflux permease